MKSSLLFSALAASLPSRFINTCLDTYPEVKQSKRNIQGQTEKEAALKRADDKRVRKAAKALANKLSIQQSEDRIVLNKQWENNLLIQPRESHE